MRRGSTIGTVGRSRVLGQDRPGQKQVTSNARQRIVFTMMLLLSSGLVEQAQGQAHITAASVALAPKSVVASRAGDCRWSSDSRRVLFTRVDEQGNPSIWIHNREAGSIKQLAEDAYAAAWSPTEERIAFLRSRSLCILDMESGDTYELDPIIKRGFGDDSGYPTLYWSRDSKRVVIVFKPSISRISNSWATAEAKAMSLEDLSVQSLGKLHLGDTTRNEDDYVLEFGVAVHLPDSAAPAIRFIVGAQSRFTGGARGRLHYSWLHRAMPGSIWALTSDEGAAERLSRRDDYVSVTASPNGKEAMVVRKLPDGHAWVGAHPVGELAAADIVTLPEPRPIVFSSDFGWSEVQHRSLIESCVVYGDIFRPKVNPLNETVIGPSDEYCGSVMIMKLEDERSVLHVYLRNKEIHAGDVLANVEVRWLGRSSDPAAHWGEQWWVIEQAQDGDQRVVAEAQNLVGDWRYSSGPTHVDSPQKGCPLVVTYDDGITVKADLVADGRRFPLSGTREGNMLRLEGSKETGWSRSVVFEGTIEAMGRYVSGRSTWSQPDSNWGATDTEAWAMKRSDLYGGELDH